MRPGSSTTRAAVVSVLCVALAACGARLTSEQRAGVNGGGGQVNAANAVDGVSRSPSGAAGGGAGGGSSGGGADGGSPGTSVSGSAASAKGSAGGGSAAGGTTGGGAKNTTTRAGTSGGTGGKSGGATGGTSGTSGGGTSGGSAGGGSASGGGTGGGTSGGGNAVTCTGTGGATDTGVTANQITIANASDISGPIPGLFTSAQQAVSAYVRYFDATHPAGVCGRQLKLMPLDSQTSSVGDQQAALSACGSAFAMVGSLSGFDDGGAQQVDSCKIPDLRTVLTTAARQASPVSFGVESTTLSQTPRVLPEFFKQKYPNAPGAAAFLYINTAVTAAVEKAWTTAYAADGFTWVYQAPIDLSTFDYTPYVAAMKAKNVKYVQWLGGGQEAVQLLTAMQQQGFTPDVFVLDPTGYDANFVKAAGSLAANTVVFDNAALLEEAGSDPELQAYEKWLQVVAPGSAPTYFGMYAWSAAALFVQLANQIGPNLTRAAMLQAIAGVHSYGCNGLCSPQDVGGKHTSPCALFIQLQGSTWKRLSPASGWTCGTNL